MIGMVPRVRIELTTRGSSGHCSTTELPRHQSTNKSVRYYLFMYKFVKTVKNYLLKFSVINEQ